MIAKTIPTVDSINSVTDTTITTTSTTDTILIRDIQLPSKAILQSFATSLWWIDLQKILGSYTPTYNSITETFDNRTKTTTSIPQTYISDANTGSKLRFLEEIVHEIRENPNKYEVSVERTDDQQSWIVIRIGNRRKHENLHEVKFADIPRTVNQFQRKRDSPVELEANYHILRIKLPYEFLHNNTLNESEIEEKQAHRGVNINSDIDMRRLNNHEEKLTFKKVPEKYIDNQHGYLYRVKIYDIDRESPYTSNITTDHEIRRKEIESSKIETTKNMDDDISRSECFNYFIN